MSKIKKRLYEILQIGNKADAASLIFDMFIVLVIVVNLAIMIFLTFEESMPYRDILEKVELVTIVIFTIEYILRLWTAEYLFPEKSRTKATLAFIFSFYGIIDLLSFVPYYIPIFIPVGVVAFRMLRVFRIMRLFRINSQYDAFNVIVDVLKDKRNQLVSSVGIISIFMLSASICMYSVEHDAQPDVFENAFSGIWWATSALLTVGYGDMYPITTLGRLLAIIITFMGVGMVAIPTGIISAGFVERYSRINGEMHVLGGSQPTIGTIDKGHPWIGKEYGDLDLSYLGANIRIRREDVGIIIPDHDLVMEEGDEIIVASGSI